MSVSSNLLLPSNIFLMLLGLLTANEYLEKLFEKEIKVPALTSTDIISTHHVPSEIDCSFNCGNEPTCVGFKYNYGTNSPSVNCQLSNTTGKNNMANYDDQGWVYFIDVEKKLTKEAAWAAPRLRNDSAQSCLDYLKRGFKTNGYYRIKNGTNGSINTVYCDFESEPKFAWTLVESFALKNKLLPAFYTDPLKVNSPVNPNSSNWNLFRMSFPQMSYLRSQSTHWRVTCSFQTNPVDIYRDYARTSFKEFDVLNYLGINVCKKMEYINIRGQQCAQCTVGWIATLDQFALHIDGPASTTCQFKPGKDSVSTEDNFGHYWATNEKFGCTKSPDATTNYWFGGN